MKHFNIVEIISMRKVQIGVIVILLIYVFIHLLVMKAYPFADLFSSFGGFGVPHNSELNPIIKENQISALKTDVKVPQVEKLNAETMAKLFEWQTKSRAKLKAHRSIDLRTAFECDIEIPILVIDGNETEFIRGSTDTNSNDFNWTNYPKVSDIGVKTRHGYRQTLGDVLSEVSRPKPTNKPLQHRPVGTLSQGGQSVNELPMVENVDNNSLMFNDNNDDEFRVNKPCADSLCTEQPIFERPGFPVFNVQFFH